MYRSAAKRLLHSLGAPLSNSSSNRIIRFRPLQSLISHSRFSTTVNSEPFVSQSPTYSDSTSSTADHTCRPRVEYQDEQARVLQASLPHVIRLGWSEAAMIAGARDVGVSPSIVGSFPRKEAALVEFFMDDCLQRLSDTIESSTEELRSLIPSERITKLVRIRLEMQAPYISKWPQALSIQAQPVNVPTSFKQRALLVDEIWHGAGDDTSDFDWYVKRTVLGGIYSTTEIYMLTDNSPNFCDTWAFLDNRVKDSFDLKKTIREATYLAEAVGAGMGSSLQGFVKSVFRG
ncbi:putative ubiquinone biosynthesis protein COQ9 [Rosa chinensis]|uniref:Ubiquinone biosynthesis protein n=1 Tax=Rosa chinensis TaxID=74649 RepID=A0A2P6SBT0_ROSCH|nr:ubiquinone biosynthesis protein COQ9, mitochondrial [Rosa chinensis]XP_040368453.1 ubiquinone biosynthesis protein COQ9, mitochondrial [Rosa chinensis]XP_040368454.1 ubiquinone biosynthesis protein COQ9, mitochondrial [Rosa chinensis]PRQ56127.1 putative ubiquinone biosynthesis protein COQ9 [Rosa chinensis]